MKRLEIRPRATGKTAELERLRRENPGLVVVSAGDRLRRTGVPPDVADVDYDCLPGGGEGRNCGT